MKTTLKLLLLFLIITLSSCEENNYYNTADGLGKVNVYIEGNITNTEAQAKLEAEIGTQTENIYIQNTTQLTTITINLPTHVRNLQFINCNDALKNIAVIGNGSMPIFNMGVGSSGVENISISGITELENLNLFGASNNATSIICNDLVTVNKALNIYANGNSNNISVFNHLKYVNNYTHQLAYNQDWTGKFIQFDMPLLEELGYILMDVRINTLTFPNLKKVNYWLDEYGTFIQNLNLPQLTECKEFSIQYHNNSTPLAVNPIVNIPLLSSCNYFGLPNTGLTSSQINSLLHQFLSVQPANGKIIDLVQTNPLSPPTGQGLIDKQTLINQGNTVYTN